MKWHWSVSVASMIHPRYIGVTVGGGKAFRGISIAAWNRWIHIGQQYHK